MVSETISLQFIEVCGHTTLKFPTELGRGLDLDWATAAPKFYFYPVVGLLVCLGSLSPYIPALAVRHMALI